MATAYSAASPAINDFLVTRADTVPQFVQGVEVADANGSVFKYCKTSGILTVGLLYNISAASLAGTGVTTTTAATVPQLIGIPQATLASGVWGWMFIGPGLSDISAAASCAQDVPLYTTGTTGVVDDASSMVVKIPGAKIITTITTAIVTPGHFASRLVLGL